jgi:chemosensory pili system protein ChpB (putative protein-glutamate methylesterase)
MTERMPRVVLLARAGKAADNLADALRQAGAELALVADPNGLDVQRLLAERPQAVLVALEPGVEHAVDELDPVLSSPGLTVIFDEAELAAKRAGWDAARWVRHLAAKLHHHNDVLPPGTEVDTEWVPSPGQLPKPASAFAALDLAPFAQEAVGRAESVPADTMPELRLPPELEALPSLSAPAPPVAMPEVSASDTAAVVPMRLDEDAFFAESLSAVELTPLPEQTLEPSTLEIVDGDFAPLETIEFDPIGSEPIGLKPIRFDRDDANGGDARIADGEIGIEGIDSDGLGMDLTGDIALDDIALSDGMAGERRFEAEVVDFDAALAALSTTSMAEPRQTDSDDDEPPGFDLSGFEGSDLEALGLAAAPPASPAMPPPLPSFTDLALAGDDALTAPAANVARNGGAMTRDLSELQQRISGLSLVDIDTETDDASASGGPIAEAVPSRAAAAEEAPDAEFAGLILIEAGLGGPDPVRQVLAALAPGFPAAVLVRLQLQGGRYDRLVAQMERAASLPVVLAADGERVRGGRIHFLPDGMGLASSGEGFRFATDPGAPGSIFPILPADSAVLFLSGGDPTLIDGAMSAAVNGVQVSAQSPEDCYDGVACAQLRNRGAIVALPSELAAQLVSRWPL